MTSEARAADVRFGVPGFSRPDSRTPNDGKPIWSNGSATMPFGGAWQVRARSGLPTPGFPKQQRRPGQHHAVIDTGVFQRLLRRCTPSSVVPAIALSACMFVFVAGASSTISPTVLPVYRPVPFWWERQLQRNAPRSGVGEDGINQLPTWIGCHPAGELFRLGFGVLL